MRARILYHSIIARKIFTAPILLILHQTDDIVRLTLNYVRKDQEVNPFADKYEQLTFIS